MADLHWLPAQSRAVLSSESLLRELIEAVGVAAESYYEKADLDGYFQFRRILSEDPTPYVGALSNPVT